MNVRLSGKGTNRAALFKERRGIRLLFLFAPVFFLVWFSALHADHIPVPPQDVSEFAGHMSLMVKYGTTG